MDRGIRAGDREVLDGDLWSVGESEENRAGYLFRG
jgi:hypothetical protein